jgi:hypothetical protein
MVKTSVLFGMLSLAIGSALAQSTLQGSVRELLPSDQAQGGLAAVTIKIVDVNRNEVGHGISDGQGSYSVEVAKAAKAPLRARYEKVGYFSFPTFREVKSLKGRQQDVLLSKGGASNEYYRAAARGAVQLSSAGPEQSSQAATIIASLPPTDRDRVVEHLKTEGSPALARDIAVAKLAMDYSDAIRGKLRGSTELQLVRTQANFPTIGAVFVYGEVPAPAWKKNVNDVASAVAGVTGTKVQNDVVIKAAVVKP